jgi:hypothetical protein
MRQFGRAFLHRELGAGAADPDLAELDAESRPAAGPDDGGDAP